MLAEQQGLFQRRMGLAGIPGQAPDEEDAGENEEEDDSVEARLAGWLQHGDFVADAGSDVFGAPAPVNPRFSAPAMSGAISAWENQHSGIETFYVSVYGNLSRIPESATQWEAGHVATRALAQTTAACRAYAYNTRHGRPASIFRVPLHMRDITARRGFMGTYCPVAWARHKELVDSNGTERLRRYGVEWRGKMFHCHDEVSLHDFSVHPTKYLARRSLPAERPRALGHAVSSLTDIEPSSLALRGFCPVTMSRHSHDDPARRFVRGSAALCVEYKSRVFACQDLPAFAEFMRRPQLYAEQSLPAKLPPLLPKMSGAAIGERSLGSMLGYVEQSVGNLLVRALLAVGKEREHLLHPSLSHAQTLLVFLSLWLKAQDTSLSLPVRERQTARLELFLKECHLGDRLSAAAPRGSGAGAAQAARELAAYAQAAEEFDQLASLKGSQQAIDELRRRFVAPGPIPKRSTRAVMARGLSLDVCDESKADA
jgi:hypothetical protein